ncbi:MAG: glycosyltransferase, partial [Deltaproteobacteria bacterium]|nr:glycosyltransferase [Deltaproteobacteria bacterium]
MDFAPLNIAFLHPNLGIGGAERLVVDAATHLQAAGHRVTLFTTHHDQARCFAETRDGLLAVRVHGDFLPRDIGQHLRVPCMIARMVPLVSAMRWYGGQFDIIFCDLVPHIIPVLRLCSRARIVFYCHFPDLLLTPPRHFLYRLYRAPIDCLEEFATGMAARVLVNSHFTAAVFRQTFPRLHRLAPEVLYPGVDCEYYTSIATSPDGGEENTLTFLSINRYEPKKNLGLAIAALALLRERISAPLFSCVRLIIAGGYDDRRAES